MIWGQVKLAVVEERYSRSQLDFERYAVLAVSSIYGIDILEDNVRQCRHRLYGVFDYDYYSRLFKNRTKNKCREAVLFSLPWSWTFRHMRRPVMQCL